LRKIEALHAGTTVDGEREAARRAIDQRRALFLAADEALLAGLAKALRLGVHVEDRGVDRLPTRRRQ
jgi:hypothetical protein